MNSSAMNSSEVAGLPSIWEVYRTTLSAWFWVCVVVVVCGSLMNSALMLAILSSRRLRSGSGLLIAHLLFSNLLQTGIFSPVLIATVVDGYSYKDYPPAFCQFFFFGFSTVTYVVNWTLLAIATNRFIAICFPHSYSKWSRPYVVLGMALACWVISFSINTEINFGIGGRFTTTPPWGTCGVRVYPNSGSWFQTVVIIGDGVPIAMTTLLYITIFIVIRINTVTSRRRVATVAVKEDAKGETKGKGVVERRYRSAKLMFWSCIWYAVTLFPAPLAAGITPQKYAQIPILSLMFRLLMFLAYATTPALFILKNADYRHRLVSCWKAIIRRGNNRRTSTSATTTISKKERGTSGAISS